MRRQGRFEDLESVGSWVLVVLVHVVVLAWLLRPVPLLPDDDSAALEVHWIDPIHPMPRKSQADPTTPASPAIQRPPRHPRVIADHPARVAPMHAAEPLAPAAESMGTLSAVFIEQARQWAQTQAPVGDFRPDPLRRREDFSGADKGERFRMRTPVTPERVVQAVGVLFGGSGYTTDPCPQVRRNLANLATGADRALVAEEVRRHRQFCQ